MKKSILLIVFGCIFFIRCNTEKNESSNSSSKKIDELNETITSLKGEKSTLEQDKKFDERIIEQLKQDIQKLEEENFNFRLRLISAKKDEVNIYDSSLYINHEIDCSLDFKYSGYNTKVYITPSIDEEIYTIQEKDVFHVTNVIYVIKNDKTFIKGKTDNGIEGFIELSRNPYDNGNYEVIDSLKIEGKNINLLQIKNESFEVKPNTIIRNMPSDNSQIVHEVNNEESWKIYKMELTYITADYKWIKISIGEYTGWITTDSITASRGGPTLETPEEFIEWDIIGSNVV